MAAWIKCTDAKNGAVWVNLDNATHMYRRDNNLTRVVFPGHGADFQDIQEHPDDLIAATVLEPPNPERQMRP